jgi:integrin-linked kinase-associated serine/threonine phosphatase 2C
MIHFILWSNKAGGSVGPNGRLQGRIEVSRALGDRQFKKVC